MDAFNEKFTIFYNNYRHYPATKKFIDEKLIFNKEKTVAFFTKHIFTAGHNSSQRSESLNIFFKGFGTMKREMTTWNIFELMTWLDKCVERIFTQMFIEIRSVINKAISTVRYCSKWVDKMWDENCDHAINLNFSVELTDVNQNTFIIWDGYFNNETRKVTYHDNRPPNCECGILFLQRLVIILLSILKKNLPNVYSQHNVF